MRSYILEANTEKACVGRAHTADTSSAEKDSEDASVGVESIDKSVIEASIAEKNMIGICRSEMNMNVLEAKSIDMTSRNILQKLIKIILKAKPCKWNEES